MKIFAQSNNNRINFSSGLSETQAKYIENLDTQKVANDIKKKYNVKCDFAKSPIIAGFSEKAFDVFYSLNRKLPTSIKTFDFPVPIDDEGLPSERTTAYVIWTSKNTGLAGRINFNRKYIGYKPEHLSIYNKICDAYEPNFASSHILQLFAHEFMHADHFLNLKDTIDADTIKKIKEVKYPRFTSEVIDNAGYYASTSPFELYANYWGREICDSLDENFVPKYNPFEEPKVKLTPDLRKFLDAIAVADARAITDIASGKTKTRVSFFHNDNDVLKKAFLYVKNLFIVDVNGAGK